MTRKKSFLEVIAENRFIHILLSIFLGFLVGAVFLSIMGLSVSAAYGRLISSVTSLKGFSYVIVYSVPYIVAGLSVAFSFKTGVFNIGAEGQFVVGSMAAACVGILAGSLPKPILIPLCFLAAMAAGAVWGIIVGVLKTKWGINEVLSMRSRTTAPPKQPRISPITQASSSPRTSSRAWASPRRPTGAFWLPSL